MKINKISIIGMGYIGLPLAVLFSKKINVVGFDISSKRIENLKVFKDQNKEFSFNDLKNNKKLIFSKSTQDLVNSDIFIIAVPTPINKNKTPDLSHLKSACELVGKYLKKGSIVIFESTVYPGCTEDFCNPILERVSKFKMNKDFFIGYSPERINFGDKKNTLSSVKKIISASNKKTLSKISKLYNTIIKAGIYNCESIKIAEAAKIIENSQRDINIAFINEINQIFDKMNLDTYKVLEAAKTKWNFLNFEPGLVGGHCIGVDPYYLTHKAKKIGFKTKVILSGREINDNMGTYIANRFINKLKKNKNSKKILIMGLSFKENIPDIRNSKVFDIINVLKKKNYKIDVFDPVVDQNEIKKYKLNFKRLSEINTNYYDGILIAVKHSFFKKMKFKKIKNFGKSNSIIYDLKKVFN